MHQQKCQSPIGGKHWNSNMTHTKSSVNEKFHTRFIARLMLMMMMTMVTIIINDTNIPFATSAPPALLFSIFSHLFCSFVSCIHRFNGGDDNDVSDVYITLNAHTVQIIGASYLSCVKIAAAHRAWTSVRTLARTHIHIGSESSHHSLFIFFLYFQFLSSTQFNFNQYEIFRLWNSSVLEPQMYKEKNSSGKKL